MRSATERIMVVDDESGMCRLLQAVLGDAGYRVSTFQNPEEAVKALARDSFDLVISDVRMPRLSGVDVLKAVKSRDANTPVILITAYGTTKAAVEAMRLGTSDYINKPIRNEEIRFVVEDVLARRRLSSENNFLRRELAASDGFGGMIGVSGGMRNAFRLLAAAAENEETFLIEGEVGTGRETSARAVHLSGRHAATPFVVADLSSLPSSVVEERLFGSSVGIFAKRGGMLAEAEGGTIYFVNPDRIAEPARTKLFRFLQEKKGRRPGSIEWSESNLRVILSATIAIEDSADLADRSFRRLAGTNVRLPALRDRLEDIAPLAAHFLARAARRAAKQVTSFSPEAVEILRSYAWTGNVGELEDVVELSVAGAKNGRIEARDLPPGLLEKSPEAEYEIGPFRESKRTVVEAFERRYLVVLLKRFDGNMTRAAIAAGMDRKNLYTLLKKHDLAPR